MYTLNADGNHYVSESLERLYEKALEELENNRVYYTTFIKNDIECGVNKDFCDRRFAALEDRYFKRKESIQKSYEDKDLNGFFSYDDDYECYEAELV